MVVDKLEDSLADHNFARPRTMSCASRSDEEESSDASPSFSEPSSPSGSTDSKNVFAGEGSASSLLLTNKPADDDVEKSISSSSLSLRIPKLLTPLIPLLLLLLLATWCGLLATYGLDHVYHQYYYKMVQNLERVVDHDTVRVTDSTYYFRTCTAADLSLWPGQAKEMIMAEDANLSYSQNQQNHVDTMMTHGVGAIPELIQHETAANLLQYAMDRNSKLTDETDIAHYRDDMRTAFAVDPVESIYVQQALHELSTNKVLKSVVSALTGDDDPAITEMSMLTSYAGADAQGWHHDVLPEEGSAVQFARTYGHSYSLFIALQDTTAEMGATQICPGTHMCGNYQDSVCEVHGFQPLLWQNDQEEPIWRAGDGVIFNQQLCHKAETHTDGPARVMFVVSFTSRSKLGLDSRVFAKGLYCFALWNIWGLTWQDLYLSAAQHIKNPFFRKLRSLGVWKPSDRNWGVDFVTKSIMEWNLRENGMASYVVGQYARSVFEALGLPNWLHGRIYELPEDEEDANAPYYDVYHDYIVSTLENFWSLFVRVNVGLAAVMLNIFAVAWATSRKVSAIRPWVWTVLAIYTIPSLVLLSQLREVGESDWGRNIRTGLTFRKPFPAIKEYRQLVDDEAGPTVMPERTDNLIGTRLDSPFLGVYAQWLSYHPGNLAYRKAVKVASKYFPAYQQGLPKAFQDALVAQVADSFSGRMLKQDWQTGNWMVVPAAAASRRIRHDLLRGSSGLLDLLDSMIDRQLARNRFDVSFRESALAFGAQTYLLRLRAKVFSSLGNDMPVKKTTTRVLFGVDDFSTNLMPAFRSTPFPTTPLSLKTGSFVPRTASNPRWVAFPRLQMFRLGDIVLVEDPDDGSEQRATIYFAQFDSEKYFSFSVGFEDGQEGVGIPFTRLKPLAPFVEGDLVFCLFDDDLFPAYITKMKPDWKMDIEYVEDGEVLHDIDTSDCRWGHD